MTEEKRKPSLLKLNQLLPLLTAILGIIGIFLPLIGYAYLEGYISVFGLNIEFLQRDLSELWVYSYYISLIGAVKLLEIYVKVVLFIIFGLFFLYILIWFLVKTIGKEKIRLFLERFENEKIQESTKGELVRLVKSYFRDLQFISSYIYIIGIIVLIFLSLFIYPFKHGQEKAKENMKKFIEQGCTNIEWSNCVSISDVNTNIELYAGYMVTSSKKYFAIYDGKKTEIVPRLEHYKITRLQNSEFKFD